VANPTRPWELLVSLIALGLGIAAWVMSNSFPRTDEGYLGPALFPKILAVVLVVAGLGLILPNIRKPGFWQSVEPNLGRNLLPVTLLLGALLLTPWLVGKIGLVMSTVLYSVVTSLLLGARWREALLVGVAMLAFVYVVFVQLLKVSA